MNEELQEKAIDNSSGECKTGFAGDDALEQEKTS